MTDKQIIYGVDVSGCCFYNNGKCDNPNGMACNCINNAVCYFKELKRKEQECEELKETIDDFITDNSSLYSYDGKQPSDLYELQECMQSSMDEFVKYKQILAQIKEIAEENIRIADLEGLNGVSRRGLAMQILQKISKCGVEK